VVQASRLKPLPKPVVSQANSSYRDSLSIPHLRRPAPTISKFSSSVGLGQWARPPWVIGEEWHNRNVKQLLTTTALTNVAIAVAALTLIAACQTVTTNDAELAASKKEFLLAQSGFRVITVTTPKQQQAINGLAQYRVSAVHYNGKLYYVFPTAKKDKIYVGKQTQYNTYKKALAAQQGSQPASQPGQQLMNPAPTMTFETAGPQHIEVEQFDGFGPMGTASLGDW
jgi:hypothetical protein